MRFIRKIKTKAATRAFSGVLLGLAILGAAVLAQLFISAPPAYAASGTWVNNNTIQVNGVKYTNCTVTKNCPTGSTTEPDQSSISGAGTTGTNPLPASGDSIFYPSGWPSTNNYSCTSPDINKLVGKTELYGTVSAVNGDSISMVTYTKPTTYTGSGRGQSVKFTACLSTPSSVSLSTPVNVQTLGGKYLNASVIQLSDGKVYQDNNLDSSYNYWEGGNDQTPNCGNEIANFSSNRKNATVYTLTGYGRESGTYCGSSATGQTAIATVKNLDTSEIHATYKWIDANTIATSDGQTTFTKQADNSFTGGTATCVSGGKEVITNVKPLDYTKDSTGTIKTSSGSGRSCTTSSQNIDIAKYNKNDPTTAAAASKNASGSTPASDDQLACDFSSNPLSWIVCPVVDAMTTFINWVDGIITDQLTINTNNVFCDNQSSCDAYHGAWKSFETIALGLIVIAGLIIVTSQALGIEILDAYTVRKTLPRLLIAVLGVAVSWPLMKFLVTLSNDLGFGVKDLIEAPFHKLAPTIDFNFGGNGFTNFFFGLGGAGVAAVAAVPLWIEFGGLAALLLYAFTAGLAILVAILVLVLRQMAVILMMLLAPIAIVAYILPNTRFIYKFWWQAFSRALLMFPLIVAFIASGRIFAAIAFNTANTTAPGINGLIGFVAYFAPYFMIPMTFRLAGSVMGAVGNFVNGRAQGGFQALSKARTEQRQARHKAARKGGLYRDAFGKFSYRSYSKDPETGRRRWQKKEGHLSGMLNAISNNTIDAQDGWRLAAAQRGGPVGRALFGRQARDLKRKIARQRIEQTANAAKVLQGRYHSARAVGGAFGYYLKDLDEDRQQELRNAFGIGKRDENGNLSKDEWLKAGGKFRGTRNEKEDLMAASIMEHGGTGAREAAAELRSSAITLSTFKGAGNDETQRFDRQLWSMMVRAQGGRLEQSEIDDYYNSKARAGNQEEAYLQTKQIQNLAAGKRTSQAEGYGGVYETDEKTGITTMRSAYDDPASDEAQTSFRRTSAADLFNGKAEDFVDPEGDMSPWALTIMAATSDHKMKAVDMMRYNPKTDAQEPVLDPRTGKPKKTLIPTGEMKDQQGLLDAQAARSKIQSGETYAQGDTGVGGQLYRIMQEAKIDPKYGFTSQSSDPTVQAAAGYRGQLVIPAGTRSLEAPPLDIAAPVHQPPPEEQNP